MLWCSVIYSAACDFVQSAHGGNMARIRRTERSSSDPCDALMKAGPSLGLFARGICLMHDAILSVVRFERKCAPDRAVATRDASVN